MRGVRVEVINTGSEILLGLVENTHLGYLSGQLGAIGLAVDRQVTVGDGPEVGPVVREAFARADLVVVTGGLGPTSDDVTRDEVARMLGRPMVYHAEVWEGILERFARRGLTAPEMVRVQAYAPAGAELLPNPYGTAPGLWIEEGEKRLVCLPGPPGELRPMVEAEVMPRLRRWVPEGMAWRRKIFRIQGLGESAVQDRIEEKLRAEVPGVEIGYCARSGEVDLRLSSRDGGLVERGAALVRGEFGEAIYAEDGETMEEVVVRRATGAGRRLATAESCTGGLIAHRLTNVPGASAVFLRGWVTYANEAKVEELGVPAQVLREQGAVSEPVARAMALGALERSGADVAVATTGIAGPGGGSEGKPVGLLYLGLARRVGGGVEVEVVERRLANGRERFKYQASQVALDWLRRMV